MNSRRWSPTISEVVDRASEVAKERHHAVITPLHLMFSLLVPDHGGCIDILTGLGREIAPIRDAVDAALEDLEGSSRPVFDPKPDKAFSGTLELADTERSILEAEQLEDVHLLISLVSVDGGLGRELRKQIGIKRAMVVKALGEGQRIRQLADGGDATAVGGGAGVLLTFCTDLTAQARAGELDPVIGRESEIAQVVEVLARRRKNNAVLVGEPGVGKTAVVEGLALAVASNKVPSVLADCQVLTLDLAAMVAGAKYKGEFEERLKKLITALEATSGRALLFIDELHSLLSTGGGAGGLDAANLLKPALARGTLRVVGCTTSGEYRKYIEKDSAFARRFVKIDVVEPDDTVCLKILEGVKGRYEEHHGVTIDQDALASAVSLSKRYIPDRFLPDKAVDLLDECASSTRIFLEWRTRLSDSETKWETLAEDPDALEQGLQVLDGVVRGLVARGVDIEADDEQATKDFPAVRSTVLAAAEGVPESVDAVQVGSRVSLRTGIPVQKMMGAEREQLVNLEAHLHERIIGQDQPVAAVSKAIRKNRAGLKQANLPIGSFMFMGPTGTGKTELAKALAALLFADESAMIRFDMSEFMQEHSVQRMTGAPPGYVGYEEGGQLTEPVRCKPYSVLLFDEIEKAHPKVRDIFLQVLDDGRLTDGQGRTVDFSNTLIIMTSNLEGPWIAEQTLAGKEVDIDELRGKLVRDWGLRPEFVNRFDAMVTFHTFTEEQIRQIVGLQLKKLTKMLTSQDLSLDVTDAAMVVLGRLSYDPTMGARPVRRTIDQRIINPLAELLLASDATGHRTLRVDADGEDITLALV